MRIFINNCDSYVGNALCADLRRADDVNNVIFGTQVSETLGTASASQAPDTVRLVSRSDPQVFLKTITSCTGIIFDLHEQDMEEMEYILKVLKLTDFEKPTTVVLISSVTVWGKTKITYDKVQPEGTDPAEVEPETVQVPFSDTDFRKRIPGPKFLEWKTIETLVMSLNSKENLKTFVLGAGILYGNGEHTFHDIFRSSWLGKTEQIRVIGGDHKIPTIHVRDLARLVKHLIEDPSITDNKYILTVDRGIKTQREIIDGIVRIVSERTTPVETMDPNEALLVENVDALTLNLIFKPSKVLNKIKWWSENGLDDENIERSAQEFCKWRKLQPIKIQATAPPGAGLEPLLERLSKYYMIPVIDVDQEVIDWIERNKPPEVEEGEDPPEPDPLYEEITTKWSEAQKTQSHLDASLLSPIIEEKLKSNVCRFRGYILPNYPDTYENTTELYITKKEEGDEEEAPPEGAEEETEKKSEIKKDILPEFVFYLQSEEEKCKERSVEEQVLPEADFRRLMDRYKKYHCPEDGSQTLQSFFEETVNAEPGYKDRSIMHLNVDDLETEDISEKAFSEFMAFLERQNNGPPYNYLEVPRPQAEIEAENAIIEEEEKEKEDKLQEEKEKNILEEHAQLQKEKNIEMEKELLSQEKQLLEQYSLPLRQYMATYVVPTLTEGLLEVCKVMPEDPVDYLAEYLFAHAQDVPSAPDL